MRKNCLKKLSLLKNEKIFKKQIVYKIDVSILVLIQYLCNYDYKL